MWWSRSRWGEAKWHRGKALLKHRTKTQQCFSSLAPTERPHTPQSATPVAFARAADSEAITLWMTCQTPLLQLRTSSVRLSSLSTFLPLCLSRQPWWLVLHTAAYSRSYLFLLPSTFPMCYGPRSYRYRNPYQLKTEIVNQSGSRSDGPNARDGPGGGCSPDALGRLLPASATLDPRGHLYCPEFNPRNGPGWRLSAGGTQSFSFDINPKFQTTCSVSTTRIWIWSN